jgi:hypothetical protein
MVASDVCEICKEKATKTKQLVVACECYKKRDRGRVHESCLKDLISTGDCEAHSLVCPLCKQQYKVRVYSEWQISKLFTSEAMGRCSNFLVNALILICFVISLTTLRTDFDEHPKMVFVVGLAGICTGIFAFYSLFTLYRKWKVSGSEISVKSIIDSVT